MKFFWLIMYMGLSIFSEAGTLDDLKNKAKTIGKKTPVDISVYVKNPSQSCGLAITGKSTPYMYDNNKLTPIFLEPGRYYSHEIQDILKGSYELEYKWTMSGKCVDSSLRTIHIFAYHDNKNIIHKRLNLGFLLIAPKICR